MRCEFGHGQLVAIRPVGQVAGWQIDRLSHRCVLGVHRKNDIVIFEHRGPLLDKWGFQRDMAIAIVEYTDAVCAKGSETDVVFLVLVERVLCDAAEDVPFSSRWNLQSRFHSLIKVEKTDFGFSASLRSSV